MITQENFVRFRTHRNNIQRYRELATSNGAHSDRFLVFGQRFPQQELVMDLTTARVPLDNVYIAREPLGGLANEYRTKIAEEDSVVIGVDHDGRIKTVKPLSQSK